jgi:tetrahydromethanopterin S-methyltransferase subunit G
MSLSEDDKTQAAALLVENERRLRIRDRQIARYGDNAAPEIILDAQDIRRKIVALKAVLEPELPDEISGLVKRRADDDYFIYQQVLGAKQEVAMLREDVAIVKQAQHLAATWRMQADERLERIEVRVDTSERKRASGALIYRIGLGIAICIGLIALALTLALIVRVVG